jgi:hypothetical protein
LNQAQTHRARAQRYREFADLACDAATRRTRLARAANFERLADEIQGVVRKPPTPARTLAPLAAPLAALWRALGRAAIKSATTS